MARLPAWEFVSARALVQGAPRLTARRPPASAEHVDRVHPENLREALHNGQGGIASASLELPDIGDRELHLVRERLLRETPFKPEPPHIDAEGSRQPHARRRGESTATNQSL